MHEPEFSEVPDFPGYRVSWCGQVQSCLLIGKYPAGTVGDEWHDIKHQVNTKRNGYIFVGLRRDGKRYNRFVHRLVLEAFVGFRPFGMECRHLDGNVKNLRLDNLCWGTKEQNEGDKVCHGRTVRGSKHRFAKLKEDNINKILCLHADGVKMTTIAGQFHVNVSTVSRIVRGKTWACMATEAGGRSV